MLCQSASAIRPTATSHSRILPKGCPASVFIAPEVSALWLPAKPHAIWSANHAINRWTAPYAIKPTRATIVSDVLLPACSALSVACLTLPRGCLALSPALVVIARTLHRGAGCLDASSARACRRRCLAAPGGGQGRHLPSAAQNMAASAVVSIDVYATGAASCRTLADLVLRHDGQTRHAARTGRPIGHERWHERDDTGHSFAAFIGERAAREHEVRTDPGALEVSSLARQWPGRAIRIRTGDRHLSTRQSGCELGHCSQKPLRTLGGHSRQYRGEPATWAAGDRTGTAPDPTAPQPAGHRHRSVAVPMPQAPRARKPERLQRRTTIAARPTGANRRAQAPLPGLASRLQACSRAPPVPR